MLNIRYKEKPNIWPGFVDLFSNLVIILIFLLIVFVFLWTTTNVFSRKSNLKKVGELKQTNAELNEQIHKYDLGFDQLTSEYESKMSALQELNAENKAKIADMEKLDTANKAEIAEMRKINMINEAKIAELSNQLGQANLNKEKMGQLEQERRELQTQMTQQRMQLSEQLTKLQAALDAAEEKSQKQEIQYVEMSSRLNKALADKVAELQDVMQYQSEFYKAIKMALGDKTAVHQEGDRFIVPSDILFSSGSYKLTPKGKNQLRLIAGVIRDFENVIPTDIDWIIRVDGHTDKKPVISGTAGYKNNTELSLLRATAVVNELVKNGVSRRRLVPTGFGELYPAQLGNDAETLQKNRRIELQLTNK